MGNDPKHWRIGLVGYGEVGRIIAEDLRRQDIAVAAYDIKLGAYAGTSMYSHAQRHGVRLTRPTRNLHPALNSSFLP